MKLKIFPFEQEIEITDEYISVLYIQDKILFSRLAHSFYQVINGQKGQERITLYQDENLLKLEDVMLFLPDLWSFDYNQKKIQNKLLQYIEKYYKMDVEEMQEFHTTIQRIQYSVQEVINEMPFEIEMKSTVLVLDILKMLGIKIADLTHLTLLERTLTLMEIIKVFELYQVIVLVNVKNYFSNQELEELYNHAMHYKLPILLLEVGEPQEKLLNEKVWFIDEDYEEFIQ